MHYTHEFLQHKFNRDIEIYFQNVPDSIYHSLDAKIFLCNPDMYWLSDIMKHVYGMSNMSATLSTALNNFHLVIEDTEDSTVIATLGQNLITSTLPILTDTLEKIVLVSIVETARNSASYWYNPVNFNKWKDLELELHAWEPGARGGGGNDPLVKDVLWGDIYGAAGGAVYGGITGATVGTAVIPGVGTVTGGAVVAMVGLAKGAITGSAAAGLEGLLKKWIGWHTIPIPNGSQIINADGPKPHIQIPANLRLTYVQTP